MCTQSDVINFMDFIIALLESQLQWPITFDTKQSTDIRKTVSK